MTKFVLSFTVLISMQAFGAVMANHQQEVFEHFRRSGFTGVVGVYSPNAKVERAFGSENERPISIRDHFLIGSVTKQFTAVAILKLYEQGRLALKDPIAQYIPEFRDRRVTIHHLLAQTSGVAEVTTMPYFGELKKRKFLELTPLIRLIVSLPKDFPAGGRWAYSNSNYFLLAKIVEVASGELWWTFVKRELVDAAEMKNTDYSAERGRHVLTGHEFDRDYGHVAIEDNAYFERGWAHGAGGIESTAGDLALWNQALYGGRLLGAEALGLMTSAQGRVNEAEFYGYGLFIATDKTTGETFYYHPGGIPGFISYNAFYPKRKMSVVAVANYAATETIDFARALAEFEINGSAVLNSYIDDPKVPQFPLDVLQGEFIATGSSRSAIELRVDENGLYASMDGQSDHRLVVRDRGAFYDRSLGLEIRFEQGSNDKFEIFTREGKISFQRTHAMLRHFSPPRFTLRVGLSCDLR